MGYNGQGPCEKGQGIKDPIVVEPRLKHEGLGIGGEEGVGECSKLIKDWQHVEANKCNPSPKCLALRETKTANITSVKAKDTKVMAT